MSYYITKQLRLIHLYAVQQKVNDTIACDLWISNNLAERYEKMFKHLRGQHDDHAINERAGNSI